MQKACVQSETQCNYQKRLGQGVESPSFQSQLYLDCCGTLDHTLPISKPQLPLKQGYCTEISEDLLPLKF
jgi:hypothetical protein